jgi:amino acid transporter
MAFFIGFDGVGALASETAEPQRNVPKLLTWILLIAGVTLSVGTLLQTPALLAHSAALDAGESPTKIMAIAGGLPSIAVAADVVLAMAGMASLIGWLNISAIIVATAANEGFLPATLGRSHPRFGSPYCAVLFLTALSVVVPIVMMVWTRAAAITSTIYLTNVMVLLWLIPYGIICAAAARRFDPREPRGAAVILCTVGAMAVILVAGTALILPINRESAAINAIGACVIAVASAILFKRGPARIEPMSPRAPCMEKD